MKSVLLVSPYPFSATTRGMDVLTYAFKESGWETHHLQFPNVVYSLKKQGAKPSSVHQFTGRRIWVPYIDSLMKNIPTWCFQRLVAAHRASLCSVVDWSRYDIVVLESGKPLFLLDLIPESTKLIYRQSDSVRLILGKNPDYIELEDRALARADHVLVPKERYRTHFAQDVQNKTAVIENGIALPSNIQCASPYTQGSVNAINIGLYPLDAGTLLHCCRSNPGIRFHIFGTGLKGPMLWKARTHSNLVCHGFALPETFLPYLIHADMFIFPFRNTPREQYYGLTSKYCMAMKFGLPIISSPRGPREDFEGLPIDFCDSRELFSRMVGEIGSSRPRRNYNLDWERIDPDNILATYKKFITELIR